MHVSFQIRIFFKYMPRSGIARSYGSSTFGFLRPLHTILLWSGGSVKNLPALLGDPGLIPWLEGSPGEENVNLLRYSCLENSMDGGAWWATVHGIAESDATERLNTILFSKVAVPIYIPTNSVEESLFLHTLSSMYYL